MSHDTYHLIGIFSSVIALMALLFIGHLWNKNLSKDKELYDKEISIKSLMEALREEGARADSILNEWRKDRNAFLSERHEQNMLDFAKNQPNDQFSTAS